MPFVEGKLSLITYCCKKTLFVEELRCADV